jgi:hypothetical protein
MRKPPMPPTAGPAGMLVPYMDARRRMEICAIVFENIGGTQRLTHEADADPKWFYTTLWSKGLPRTIAAEVTTENNVESLLDKVEKLEAQNNAIVINGEYTEVSDATD